MTSKVRRFQPLWSSPPAWVGLALLAMGCNGGTQSASQALEHVYKENPQLKRLDLAKFAGRVTVDGQPPAARTAILVILNDAKKPWPDQSKTIQNFTVCLPDGAFQFSTSLGGDGTLAGSYVVTFAQLHPKGKRGLFPPDELKNLYNDPEINAKKPEFLVELTPPGKTDYEFNLKVAGEEPITKPGPHAVTKVLW